jgi:hypothetical protein
MQAIETRWMRPTDHKGARIVARAEAGRVVVSWDHSLNPELNHRAAARELVRKLGWFGTWCSGAVPSLPNGYVHVNCRREEPGWTGNYETWCAEPSQ